MEKVQLTASGSTTSAARLEVPACVPTIGDDALDAAVIRSAKARKLHEHLCAREAAGEPLTAREVGKVVKAATGPRGKPDAEQAAVIAAHAQSHPEVFGGAYEILVRYLERVVWDVLVADLENFIARVRADEAETRRREDVKNDRDRDRLDFAMRHASLLRMERARREPPPVDAELSSSNQLRLTMERLKRP